MLYIKYMKNIRFNKNDILSIFFMALSALLMAFALNNFTIPLGIYPAGVSGLSRLTTDLSRDYFSFTIPYYFIYTPINLILAIIVFKYVGKKFTIFSIIQVLFTSIFQSIIPSIIVLDDPILICIFGGVVNGLGVGMALKHNASSGGTDFLGIYFANKYKRPIWNELLYFNVVFLIIVGLIYGMEKALYSIVFQFCSTQMVKNIHKCYTKIELRIVTDYPDEVAKKVLARTRHGITKIDATGVYSNSNKTMLYMVINGYQESEVVEDILFADPKAFISIVHAKNVIGNFYQKPLD